MGGILRYNKEILYLKKKVNTIFRVNFNKQYQTNLLKLVSGVKF